MKKTGRKAPETLSAEARDWWQKLQREYAIEDQGGLLLLQTALEAFDRARQAQQDIDRDGLLMVDRFGQTKSHPLLGVERDARAQLITTLKALNLDVEPLRDGPGRPGGK